LDTQQKNLKIPKKKRGRPECSTSIAHKLDSLAIRRFDSAGYNASQAEQLGFKTQNRDLSSNPTASFSAGVAAAEKQLTELHNFFQYVTVHTPEGRSNWTGSVSGDIVGGVSKPKHLVIPPELEGEMTPGVKAFVLMLLERIAELEARVEELSKRDPKLTPENSSLPPSSQHPHAKIQDIQCQRESEATRGSAWTS